MALKPGQLKCIQTLDAPLAVSAGAGSGKTFTLTRRIVNALSTGAIEDVGQVLAITFTTKAAAELKSRVRSALRAEGMVDQALKVDAAWISTIHGMCARMLRAHALEVGIDPAFSVIDETQARALLNEAMEEVLSQAGEFASPEGLDALFSEYPARACGYGGGSVEEMVRSLVYAASSNPIGIDAVLVPEALRAEDLMRRMMELAERVAQAAGAQKPGKSRDAFLHGTALALEACQRALENGAFAGAPAGAFATPPETPAGAFAAGASPKASPGAPTRVSSDAPARGKGACSPFSVVDLLNGFPAPSRAFGTKEYKQFAADAAEEYAECMAEARFGQAVSLLQDVKRLAARALDAFRRLKREAGGLDNDDLLVETARAFECCPTFAADYADRFKLVMVDEFQDTDQLQVDMIKRMAGAGGERLCAVGDAQQSIYRFRGADVSVYRRQVAAVREENPEGLILLPDNFRSHADVLAFVDRIFGQPQSFGASFMSLSASRDESRVAHPFKSSGPRIDVSLVTYPYMGVPAADVCRTAAHGIAQRFANLRAAGHTPGEMVLLLGSTTKAGVYAEELRRAGFPCVVVKGSIFNRAPEVQLMVSLAQAVANPFDSLALFEVLSSEMFALSADDFLALATHFDDDGRPHRRSLFDGLALAAQTGELSPQLEAAFRTVGNMVRATGRDALSSIMERAVRDCGWLTRLSRDGAEGIARAANVLKAVRMVEEIEAGGASSPADAASRFALKVETVKEAPGALSAAGGDFVRIMTVHASKGLEFPIVAVAELSDSSHAEKLVMERVEGSVYASLDLGNSVAGAKSSELMAKAADATFGMEGLAEDELADTVVSRSSAGARRVALCALRRKADEQESRRLLYVALTRAKEALIVSLTGKRTKADLSGASTGLAADIQSALCGQGGLFPQGCATFDFGGERKAAFERIDLEAEPDASARGEGADGEDTEAEDADGEGVEAEGSAKRATGDARAESATGDACRSDAAAFDVFAVCDYRVVPSVAPLSSRADVFSYSSIASVLPSESEPRDFPDKDDEAWARIRDSLDVEADATDLGTAFHRLAQYAIECRVSGAALAKPPESRVIALSRSCSLGEGQRMRLARALDRWFASSVASRVAAYRSIRAEVPFFLALDDKGRSVYLEGEVDLLAMNDEGGDAFVVDYKTGGHAGEDEAHLREKHRLQAVCYAWAVLGQGFRSVDVTFVRVEQGDIANPSEPQCMNYTFSQDDLLLLEGEIKEALHRVYGTCNR